jgi:hypothetical protein
MPEIPGYCANDPVSHVLLPFTVNSLEYNKNRGVLFNYFQERKREEAGS